MNGRESVTVGFSGGKDSTTAIILLKEKGYDVSALTMRLGLSGEEEKLIKVKELAEMLNVPHEIIDLRTEFKERVITYFVESYKAGITPNPCVICNNRIKFELLMDFGTKNMGSSFFATGHYADKIEIDGKYFLKEPEERKKSQIYFLSMIGGERLKKVLFPISSISLDKVREMVVDLPLGNRKESQDVCFLSGYKLADYLKEHIPEAFEDGDILDISGNKIGRHNGSINFTIGQRRGTGFSSDGKLYVIGKNVIDNTITLGKETDLYSDSFEVKQPVIWKEIKKGEHYKVRIRYMSKFEDVVIKDVSPDLITAEFTSPVKSVTPGQVGAFFQNDIIVASGFIV
ncbi:MAG: tRNA 2-thiouridine(34) synthase MnmA [Acidobacteriota bacterium]